MCSIATRHMPSGSLRHTIVPSHVDARRLGLRLARSPRTPRPRRPPGHLFPPYEAGGSTPIPTAAWTWPWRGGTHAPPPRARHLRRTPHPRCTRRPRRLAHPPRAQSPGVALLLGSRTRRTSLSDPWPPHPSRPEPAVRCSVCPRHHSDVAIGPARQASRTCTIDGGRGKPTLTEVNSVQVGLRQETR